jgi:RNA polymerase sigma-70 factor (sigma-E family)
VTFDEYVAARADALERYAFVLTGDRFRAQDLTQTALLKAYRRWWRIERTEFPDAYVRRIMTRSFLDWRRRRSNSEQPVAEMPGEKSVAATDPAERVVVRDELQRGLDTLTRHQRAVLVLRYHQGCDDEAIAGFLGCSAGTVRTHASRGLGRLRDFMAVNDLPEGSR